ncbi:MAG TPA: discoidin domain-containing protein [Polyangiaceae bacterium]
MNFRGGSLGAWLLAAACSSPATNFFDSPAAAGRSSTAGAGSVVGTNSVAGKGSFAGMSSVAGTSDDGGGRAASDAAGTAEPDDAGSTSTSGGGGGESGTTPQGGAANGAGSAGAAGAAGFSGGSAAGSSGEGAGSAGVSGNTGAGGGSADPIVQLDGNATASSWESDFGPGGGFHPPRDANDGDLTTRWCASAKTLPQWWQLDLGGGHELSRIEIVWEYPGQAMGYPYGFKVGVSDDATVFPSVPAIDNSSNQSTSKTQIVSFPAQTAGRYVRVTVTSLPPDMNDPDFETWASMNEVRVFGH